MRDSAIGSGSADIYQSRNAPFRWLGFLLVGFYVFLAACEHKQISRGKTRVGDPEGDILRSAARAIETHNAVLLCRLADPQELNRLHLTPVKVEGFLNRGVWKHGPVKVHRIVSSTFRIAKRAAVLPLPNWALILGRGGDLAVAVRDVSGSGWKLGLSQLLYEDNCRHAGPGRSFLTYRQLAQEYKVSGVMTRDGIYHPLSELPVRMVFGRDAKGVLFADCGLNSIRVNTHLASGDS